MHAQPAFPDGMFSRGRRSGGVEPSPLCEAPVRKAPTVTPSAHGSARAHSVPASREQRLSFLERNRTRKEAELESSVTSIFGALLAGNPATVS